MQPKGGACAAYKRGKAYILHDDRVDRQGTGLFHSFCGVVHFVVRQERVECKVYLYSARVAVINSLFELLLVKVLSGRPRAVPPDPLTSERTEKHE